MRKIAAFILAAFMLGCPIADAASPSNVPVVPTVAALKSIPVSTAPFYPNVMVQGYSSTSANCPAQYKWNASDSTADNGGSIINPTGNGGNGRWNLTLPPHTPVHSCLFGVVADVSPPNSGNGTDQTSKLQALLTWAHTSGPNWVHIDGAPNNCIKTLSSLTLYEGEIIEGDGEYPVTGSISYGTCISYLASLPGDWVFKIQTPYPGLGTVSAEAPKFRDIGILYGPTDTSPGGCVQFNSIAGGFTDTSSSQQPLVDIDFRNVYCAMPAINNSQKIGFQCSKCVNGRYDTVTVFGGNLGFDLEGSENITIRGGTVSGGFGPNIYLQGQLTFGNNDVVEEMQLLSQDNYGQTVDSIVFDAARSSTIQNNFFETLSGVTTLSHIHLSSGLSATVSGNAVTGTTTNWLLVDGIFNNITAIGNTSYGTGFGSAKFNNGNYLYNNTGILQILSHHGNGSEVGWPFESLSGVPQTAPKIEEIYTPSYPGLSANGYGPSEIPVNYAFTFPVTGSSNYLDFSPNQLGPTKGTLDAQIRAWQSSGTGQITCQLTDGGTLVGSSVAQAITATPQWYTLAFAQSITTNAGIRCWDTGGSSSGNASKISQINIVDH